MRRPVITDILQLEIAIKKALDNKNNHGFNIYPGHIDKSLAQNHALYSHDGESLGAEDQWNLIHEVLSGYMENGIPVQTFTIFIKSKSRQKGFLIWYKMVSESGSSTAMAGPSTGSVYNNVPLNTGTMGFLIERERASWEKDRKIEDLIAAVNAPKEGIWSKVVENIVDSINPDVLNGLINALTTGVNAFIAGKASKMAVSTVGFDKSSTKSPKDEQVADDEELLALAKDLENYFSDREMFIQVLEFLKQKLESEPIDFINHVLSYGN